MSEIQPNTKNVLASDVEIKGSIKFQNDLTIDGKVEGEIVSPGVLVVGENAEIRGEIKTKGVTVLGKVHGNITVEERCEARAARSGWDGWRAACVIGASRLPCVPPVHG